jgi:peptide/nickel transport system ATP-binding protein
MNIRKLIIKNKKDILVDISFQIQNSLALVGQSGSGKSLTLKALLDMLPNNLTKELIYDADFSLIAGESIAFVPQNPFTALSSLTKIKKQFFVSEKRQKELLSSVGLDISFLQRFPPELSGGQLQRIVIAMALEKNPKLLLLDEPTTALDIVTKHKIITLLKKLQLQMGFKILFVTHDIDSAKDLCENICIIKDGTILEDGKMSQVLQYPKNKYTKTLIQASFANRKFRK